MFGMPVKRVCPEKRAESDRLRGKVRAAKEKVITINTEIKGGPNSIRGG